MSGDTFRERLLERARERDFVKADGELNMKQLSLATGMGETLVRDQLKRRQGPRLHTIQQIAPALGCSVAYLIGETDIPEPEAIKGDLPHQAAEFTRLLLQLSSEDRERSLTMIRALVRDAVGEAPQPVAEAKRTPPRRRAASGD